MERSMMDEPIHVSSNNGDRNPHSNGKSANDKQDATENKKHNPDSQTRHAPSKAKKKNNKPHKNRGKRPHQQNQQQQQQQQDPQATKGGGSNKKSPTKEKVPLPPPNFDWILRCDASIPLEEQPLISWSSQSSPIPKKMEESMLGVLMKYGRRELGMMKFQPDYRVLQVKRLCIKNKVPLLSALSLRRHHIHRFNPYLPPSKVRLGTDKQIKKSADCFEDDVQDFLQSQSVLFHTEADQTKFIKDYIAKHKKEDPNLRCPPTPDFILKKPIRIKRHRRVTNPDGSQHIVLEETSINWVEVKMFYGASTITPDGKSAVGRLRSTAEKYMKLYGPGAFVFAYGFGDELERDIEKIGAICLECSDENVRSTRQRAHIKTYCSNPQGEILI